MCFWKRSIGGKSCERAVVEGRDRNIVNFHCMANSHFRKNGLVRIKITAK